jgi:hypothetical protein
MTRPALIVALSLASALALAPDARAQQSPDTTASAPDVFMWLGGRWLFEDEPEMAQNLLHFARRHRIIPYEASGGRPDVLRTFLKRSRAAGVRRTWIEIRPRTDETDDATAQEFAQDPARRKATLQRFRKLARIYRRHYPDFARITIFDEAPLGAFANVKGNEDPYGGSADAIREYGPQAFAYMKEALQSEMPEAEVGVFLHHPHNASPETGGEHSFVAEFVREAAALDAAPDFLYSDVYRGYLTRGYGFERTNEYITDVVRHTREVGARYGAEVYHLGQAHTIKLGYTPGRREIDGNVRATLAGGADGLGWYWPNYASTNHVRVSRDSIGRPTGYDVSFDPFVPNAWGKIGPAGSLYGTSRDRFTYAYLRALEATGRLRPERRFDLWIYGRDFDHVEHRVSLRAPGDSAWTFVGYFNPQQDADGYREGARSDLMYSYDGRWHAVAFHGLRRERLLGGDSVQVKIETPNADKSDSSKLNAVYAMPYRRTRNYATEDEITRLIEEHPRWLGINSLARYVRPKPLVLRSGEAFTVTLRGNGAGDGAGAE